MPVGLVAVSVVHDADDDDDHEWAVAMRVRPDEWSRSLHGDS